MVSLVLLAGGKGLRLGEKVPKQYLQVSGKPLALHSLDTFCEISLIREIVVVCHLEYQSFFSKYPVIFALPGDLRQDSAYAGLQKCSQALTLVHDAARPQVEKEDVLSLIDSIQKYGAAALGSRVTSTIKRVHSDFTVAETLQRSSLWEMYTPQGATTETLLKAYTHACQTKQVVTDELHALETIGLFGKIVPSLSRSLKVTHPEDLLLLKKLLYRS